MKIKLPDFDTKKELYAYLKANKHDIFELKKSELKRCDPAFALEVESSVSKAEGQSSDTDSQINRTIIGNTYYWMDSHDDVHVSGCFGVSIKQRTEKRISHLHDHIHQLVARVGKFSKVYEQSIAWKDLGVNKNGDTEALFADSTIYRSMNQTIFDMYKDGEIDQHSVGMYYVQLSLAINDPEEKEEYAEWEKYIDLLGNKADAEKQGYFFVVKEAKLIEISCVLNGSNILTPTLPVKAPSTDRQEGKSDPPLSSHKTTEAQDNAKAQSLTFNLI